MTNAKAIETLRALLSGEWDNPSLLEMGLLSTDPVNDIVRILNKVANNTLPENLHVFRVIYLPTTGTLPARVKIISDRFKQSIIVSYHADAFEDCRDAQEIAVKHLTSLGYNITSIGEGWGCMYVISDTFKPLKE